MGIYATPDNWRTCLYVDRFRCERQWRDLTFCLSLLSYNERSIRKLQENFSCFADKLSEEFVYSCFVTIVAGARKFAKPEAKVSVSSISCSCHLHTESSGGYVEICTCSC